MSYTASHKNISTSSSYWLLVVKMILCAAFWGGTFVVGKIAATYADAPFIGFFRFLTASIVLYAVLLTRGGLPRLTKKQFLGVTILALTGIWAYNMFFFYGLKTVPAARASLIVANNPLFIALGAALFLGERLTILKFSGICVSICGAVIIISGGHISNLFNSFAIGDIAIVGCVFSWAIYSLVGKVLLQKLSPLVAVTWACIIGTIFFIPFAFNSNSLTQIASMPVDFWLCALYLGIFGSALGFVWFYEAVKGLGATQAGVFINFVPVFGVLLGAIFLGEAITSAILVGGLFTITGVYLANK